MAKTVLEVVQSILNDMDSEPVNSLSDTQEAQQVASVLAETFEDIVSTRSIPEHNEILKLTASSDTDYPSEFSYPDNVRNLRKVWYDVQENNPATDADRVYREICWLDPLDFLQRVDSWSGDYTTVLERSSGTVLRIANDRFPKYYTSFDDEYIVMDSYHSTYDTTLQASKVRAYGIKTPTLNENSDSAIIDLDEEYTQYLIRETTARCFDLFKGGVSQKMEQSVRRVKNHLVNDKYRTSRSNIRTNYGR